MEMPIDNCCGKSNEILKCSKQYVNRMTLGIAIITITEIITLKFTVYSGDKVRILGQFLTNK